MKTGWKRVDALADDDIREAVKADPDPVPLWDEAWFRRAKLVMPASPGSRIIASIKEAIDWAEGKDVAVRVTKVGRKR